MVNASSDRWLGLDIGATKILGLVIEASGAVLGLEKVESRRDDGPEAVLDRAVRLARDLVARHGDARGVGAGFAGLVDHARGQVLSSIMLPGWDRFPLARRLEEALGIPSLVDNDANTAAYGELVAMGSPRGVNLILLTVGTGIGGAIIIDGRMYRGALGTAAEFGNATIDWRGEKCWCGSRGCLNMLGSGTAITANTAALAGAAPPLHSLSEVAEAARDGNSAARRALDQGADALAAGIANLINIFNPDRVALTGGVIELGEPFLDRVRREAERRSMAEPFAHAVIDRSVLGYEAGAVGAACLVRDDARREGAA